MKGLKEFLELLAKDEALQEEVKKVRDDTPKIVEIAKKHGYTFTEQEYDDLKMEAVSGGISLDGILNKVIDKSLSDPKAAENLIKIVGGLKDNGTLDKMLNRK